MTEIVGVVEIQRDPRQREDRRPDAAGLGGGEMREEAVVAKPQRYRIGRRYDDRVRAELVMRRGDREGGGRAVRIEELRNLRGGDERDVAGECQHAARAVLREMAGRGGDRAGMAVTGAVDQPIE